MHGVRGTTLVQTLDIIDKVVGILTYEDNDKIPHAATLAYKELDF